MTQPEGAVWDGDGIDPWLPTRLARDAEVVASEQQVYDAYYARLLAWLVLVERGVLAPTIPDPTEVFQFAPQWAAEMAEFTDTTIRELVGRSYEVLLGDGYDFDSRPFVADYLAQVNNRLMNVPDQVFDLIAGEVAEGAASGESIPEIRDRIQTVFDAEQTPHWSNRATVVARSETISALNAGRFDSFAAVAEELGGQFERVWLATADERTRPTHRLADQQRVGIGEPFLVGGFPLWFPGDPSGPPQEVIQCVPEDTEVWFPSIRAITRRWFEGEMLTIRYSTGDKLSVTPNHPILRSDGIWTSAGLLVEGDDCVRSTFGGQFAGKPHEDGGPAKIGEMYRAASQTQMPGRIPLSPPDFHGDGADGDVEVVPMYGKLAFWGEPASDQQVNEFGFAFADLARAASRRANGGAVPLSSAGGEVNSLRAPSAVCCDSKRTSFFGSTALETSMVGVAGTSDRKSQLLQPSADGRTAHPEHFGDSFDAFTPFIAGTKVLHVDRGAPASGLFADAAHAHPRITQPSINCHRSDAQVLGQRQDAFAGLVSTAKVVKIDRYAFSGHVYNLDTGEGWYSANGITVRNCRCTMLLTRPGETLDLSNRQFLES